MSCAREIALAYQHGIETVLDLQVVMHLVHAQCCKPSNGTDGLGRVVGGQLAQCAAVRAGTTCAPTACVMCLVWSCLWGAHGGCATLDATKLPQYSSGACLRSQMLVHLLKW